MFNSTTIPVLEQVVNYAQARHGILAGNIANLDTPGYRTQDISPEQFESNLKEAIEAGDQEQSFFASPSRSKSRTESLQQVSESLGSILFHDESNVGLENQVAAISKNQNTHNLALTIMRSQFQMLETAISERVI